MSRTASLVRFVGLACAGATLAACSGGGGSHGSTTSPASGGPTPGSAPALVSSITPQLATVLAGAARAVTAVTSYDYRHLDASHDAAVRYLAEPFRSKYEQSWSTVQSQAPKQHAVITGKIDDVGLSDVAPDRVTTLVFSRQTITNTSTPQPRVDAVALRVTMTRSAGGWLVSDLEGLGPVSPGDSAKTAWAASDIAAAVLAGRQCAGALNTLDAQHLDQQLATMQQCITGELLRSLKADQDELRRAVAQASTTGTVVGAGISATATDRVSLLVAVAVKTTRARQAPTSRLSRLVLTLQQDGGQWLVSQASPVQ